MLVAVLFSAPVNGTRRWFGVGGLGIQPSELAKIGCVFFTALILERRMHRIDDLSYSLLPIGLIIGLIVALILLQPDFGTSISLALVVAVMIFAAGLHYRYFVGLALGGHLRFVRRARADDDDCGAGVREHQRGARADADERDSAAARQLRGVVAADQPARHGRAAEHLAARVDRGMRCEGSKVRGCAHEPFGADCRRWGGRASVSGG